MDVITETCLPHCIELALPAANFSLNRTPTWKTQLRKQDIQPLAGLNSHFPERKFALLTLDYTMSVNNHNSIAHLAALLTRRNELGRQLRVSYRRISTCTCRWFMLLNNLA